jgi:hypothetical protein
MPDDLKTIAQRALERIRGQQQARTPVTTREGVEAPGLPESGPYVDPASLPKVLQPSTYVPSEELARAWGQRHPAAAQALQNAGSAAQDYILKAQQYLADHRDAINDSAYAKTVYGMVNAGQEATRRGVEAVRNIGKTPEELRLEELDRQIAIMKRAKEIAAETPRDEGEL